MAFERRWNILAYGDVADRHVLQAMNISIFQVEFEVAQNILEHFVEISLASGLRRRVRGVDENRPVESCSQEEENESKNPHSPEIFTNTNAHKFPFEVLPHLAFRNFVKGLELQTKNSVLLKKRTHAVGGICRREGEMKVKIAQFTLCSGLLAGWLFGMGGCSTTQVVPDEPPPVTPPPYVQVPHPAGTDMADLRAILFSKGTPTAESLKTCDADFTRLRMVTQSDDERREGVRELLRRDPVFYHWCFYTRIFQLDEALKTATYIDEKQKKVIEAYLFIVPVARAFMSEFHDSRYLRWAVLHYKRLSEWVFYRKLELSPEETAELVQISNPFGLWREATPRGSILEKYNIVAVDTGTQPAPASDATFNPGGPVLERAPASSELIAPADEPPPTAPADEPPPPPPAPADVPAVDASANDVPIGGVLPATEPGS